MPARQLKPADALAQLAFLIHGTLERVASEHDVSMTQMRLLGILRDRTPTMNELASLLALDKSSVSGLVDRAERRGLVERVASDRDRRVVQVRMTRVGRSLATRAAARYDSEATDILSRLPAAERRTLTALVSRLLVAHAEEHDVELFPESRSGVR